MEPGCFVQVLPGPGGVPPGGTGYLIRSDRVLTAAHVVKGAEAVEVRYDRPDGTPAETARATVEVRHDRAYGATAATKSATVLYRGDEECDVAVLALAAPVEVSVPVPRLGDTPLRTTTPWESRGWAAAAPAPAEPLVRDALVDLFGEASPFHAAQKRCQLEVRVTAKETGFWRGVSGAPVFEQGANGRLIAVMADAPLSFDNVLRASPLTAAFARRGFVEALGSDIARERRDRLIADVERILDEQPRLAAAAVAERKPEWRARYEAGVAAALTAQLLETADVAEVLIELDRAHAGLWKGDAVQRCAAETVKRVVERTAPLLVQRSVLAALPGERGGAVLSLPFETRTIVELALAGFDGRPSCFRQVEGDFPEGLGRLLLPAELGLDSRGAGALAEYVQHHELGPYLTTEYREILERKRRLLPDGERVAREEVFKLVNARIEYEAAHPDRPLRRYLLYDGQFSRDYAPFLAELRKNMPAIHLVELAGGDLIVEHLISLPLRALLGRGGETGKERRRRAKHPVRPRPRPAP